MKRDLQVCEQRPTDVCHTCQTRLAYLKRDLLKSKKRPAKETCIRENAAGTPANVLKIFESI